LRAFFGRKKTRKALVPSGFLGCLVSSDERWKAIAYQYILLAGKKKAREILPGEVYNPAGVCAAVLRR